MSHRFALTPVNFGVATGQIVGVPPIESRDLVVDLKAAGLMPVMASRVAMSDARPEVAQDWWCRAQARPVDRTPYGLTSVRCSRYEDDGSSVDFAARYHMGAMEPTMISGAVLKQDVEEELAWRPDIDSDHIGVTTDNGIVTLKGYVPSYAQKHAAEAAVKRVAGVRGVVESLQVYLAGSNPAEDEELARRAINSLDWDAWVPSQSVKVTVEGGWVSLSGEVSWQYQKNAADDAVRKLSGVVGVTNTITIKHQPQPLDIKQRIERALKRSAELDSKAVRVSVANGIVTLEGTVDSWAALDQAERAVWAAPGVIELRDNLRVVL